VNPATQGASGSQNLAGPIALAADNTGSNNKSREVGKKRSS
jgi:hypothetical protein